MAIIKITVQSGPSFQSYSFEKETIRIGQFADLSFAELEPERSYVEISLQKNVFFAINVENDPFILMNGLPFGKKKLHEGDTLNIGPHTLLIEQLSTDSFSKPQPLEALSPLLDKFTHQESSELSSSEIESFMMEVGEEPEQIFTPTFSKTYEAKFQHAISLKDDDVDEETAETSLKDTLLQWKWLLWTLLILFAVAILIALEMFFRLNGAQEAEELKAAKSVSDVAMALTYAQLHQASTGKQNWSDPNFIENNLMAVVSPQFHPDIGLFSKRQDSQPPYTLRIYISNDLSHFVLIAQPAPSFLQWLLPKKAIMVDSKTMLLRRTHDFKALNRILSSPNPLEGASSLELEALFKQSEFISLVSLAAATGDTTFIPPKALKVMRPGAENLIYNAPRYYEFGEHFLLQALALSDIKNLDSNEQIKMSNFKDLVIYVPETLSQPSKAEKVLSRFSPEGNFLLGYLKYDMHGKIKSSHLMLDSDHVWSRNAIAEDEEATMSEGDDVIISDPVHDNFMIIIKQMQDLANTRVEALKPTSKEIAQTIEEHNAKGSQEKLSYLQHLINDYEAQAFIQDDLLIKELEKIRSEHPEITQDDFNYCAQQAGVESFILTNINHHEPIPLVD